MRVWVTLCRGEFGRRRQVWSPYNPHTHQKARPACSHPGAGPPGRQTNRWTAPVLGEKTGKKQPRASGWVVNSNGLDNKTILGVKYLHLEKLMGSWLIMAVRHWKDPVSVHLVACVSVCVCGRSKFVWLFWGGCRPAVQLMGHPFVNLKWAEQEVSVCLLTIMTE